MRVAEPVELGSVPEGDADPASLWWRHERMARRVMQDPETLAALFLPERDDAEREWLADPPTGQEAFDRGSKLLDEWSARVDAAATERDVRPWYARRYWSKRAVPA